MAIWFKPSEVQGLRPRLVAMLDEARTFAEVPFEITSGYRTLEENEAVGGSANSAHLRGLAVDLRCKSSWRRMRMVSGLLRAGFRRIVLYPDAGRGHIHADIDKSLPQGILKVEGVDAS